MTSILFGMVRISRPRSKCNYPWNQKLFLILLFHFWNLQFLKMVKEKMIVKATLFRKLQTVKDLIKPFSKKYRFRRPFESKQVKGCQTLVKSYESTFIIFFRHSERTWFYKSLGPFNMWTVKGCSQTMFFRESSNQVIHSL